MSTHNIGFYEDLTKNIFQLSSNIIKYAPYFFCCVQLQKMARRDLNFYIDYTISAAKYEGIIIKQQHS